MSTTFHKQLVSQYFFHQTYRTNFNVLDIISKRRCIIYFLCIFLSGSLILFTRYCGFYEMGMSNKQRLMWPTTQQLKNTGVMYNQTLNQRDFEPLLRLLDPLSVSGHLEMFRLVEENVQFEKHCTSCAVVSSSGI